MRTTKTSALNTWCHVTLALGHTNSQRTPEQQDGPAMCVADNCMAWRWLEQSMGDPQEGYCGLAGKPR